MQFVANGPDIPDALLQAHEEGRVVFFCGAGISYPAGLKDFRWLVQQIYHLNHTVPLRAEKDAFERGHFDATLDLLERRLPGQRVAVRGALARALKPNLRRKGATDTHAALLRLACDRKGDMRLVTTNFDRVFHRAAKRTQQKFEAYAAPMLPIPKNCRWNGLAFLHGLLPEKLDQAALNRLVITSGDFGLAYLTERWAARFVSELFRNYIVCFLGYRIKDPVLRYMMDALAADRMLGESTPQAWAFGDCEPGQEKDKILEWEAKGVTPILYEALSDSHGHSALHRTMHAWADIYNEGVLGKERIVVTHALARPAASTQQDDFTGRMLWALSDSSGLPAKRFADFNPVPSLDWMLEAFSEERFQHNDLARFGVSPRNEIDTKLRFSLIRRPAPYNNAPPMRLTSPSTNGSRWDGVMYHLARWLLRHLDDPRLIIWIARQDGQLHEQWHWLIENQLDRLASMESSNRPSELEEIRVHAPKAVPGTFMKKLWRLLLSGRVRSLRQDHNLYSWIDRLKREGLTTTLRFQFRELLAPQVILKEPFHWGGEAEETHSPTHLSQLVNWELTLATDHMRSVLETNSEPWSSAVPLLLDELQQLLRDALDLLRELSGTDDQSDQSHWYLPSICPHWQNQRIRDWVILIELLRDAWLTVNGLDNNRATQIARTWFDLPYPTFKRLAFFAASHDGCVTAEQWVDWLLSGDAQWLWSENTKREVFRLLVLQGQHLNEMDAGRLEAAILSGPASETDSEHFDTRQIWLYLTKLQESGASLSANANARLVELSSSNPQWKLMDHEREEFSSWMSGTGDPDYEVAKVNNKAPRKRQQLVRWLQQQTSIHPPFYEDNWSDVCRRHLLNSLCALKDLATAHIWPSHRWREAMQVWSDSKIVRRSWQYAAPIVTSMPDSVLQEIVWAATWWLESVTSDAYRYYPQRPAT